MALLSGRTSFQAHWPVRWSAGTTSPVGVVSASTRVMVPLSSSGTSSSRAKTRWAPAMAMTTKFTCWLIWMRGWVAFLFRVRKEIRVPRVRGKAPPRARRAPTTAQTT